MGIKHLFSVYSYILKKYSHQGNLYQIKFYLINYFLI